MRYQQPLVYVDAVAKAGSIRRAAQTLAITSTALNRRILALEEDVGTPLFERLPNGVRLSAAGELFLDFARREFAETERMRNRIADLSGQRRGHVNIACSQALMHARLPRFIAEFRARYPAVTFGVRVCKRTDVTVALESFEADVAIVYEPELTASLDLLAARDEPVRLLCAAEHPLAVSDTVRLGDCFEYPMAMPTRGNGVRYLLEEQAQRLGRPLPIAIESDNAILLQRSIGIDGTIAFVLPASTDVGLGSGLTVRPLDERDLPPGQIGVVQLRGRTLPVAAARFVERLREAMREYGTVR